MIVITFDEGALLDVCVDQHRAEQQYGSIAAEALTTLLADAAAFDNVGQLLDILDDDGKILPDDSLSISIGSDYGAAFVAVGKRFKRDADGRVMWNTVTRIKLVEISRVP